MATTLKARKFETTSQSLEVVLGVTVDFADLSRWSHLHCPAGVFFDISAPKTPGSLLFVGVSMLLFSDVQWLVFTTASYTCKANLQKSLNRLNMVSS